MSTFILSVLVLASGWATGDAAKIAKGREVYETGCAQCHGKDGRGNPEWESAVRPVEFSDCGTTAEASEHWQAIVKNGGRWAGLAPVMPAFGEAFSDEEIAAAIAYIRTFCATADRYPPGDLNFRRALKTGKAFPEQELVLSAAHRPESGNQETAMELAYENRIGPRFQYEIVAPLRLQSSGEDGSGLGDLEIELKHVLAFSQKQRAIVAMGVGGILPTGSESKGLGSGTPVVSGFAALGKGFGRGRTFLQSKVSLEVPTKSEKADTEFHYAIALSHALGPARRAFTPAIEWTGAYNTKTKAHDSSAWIELSKPLNRLGHVIASVGAQIPIRSKQDTWKLQAFVLWDFGDGPFWTGW